VFRPDPHRNVGIFFGIIWYIQKHFISLVYEFSINSCYIGSLGNFISLCNVLSYGVMEQESNDRHRRWFRTMGEINRQRTPTWFRTIPPPPPISRIEQVRTERDEAIRLATERIDKNKLKDFKFLRTNVKDTER
jgi:hypothetical protein